MFIIEFTKCLFLAVIEVKSTLAVGTYPLRLLVTDHCIDSGIITITVTVTKKVISNLI